eukprot:4097886-Pleurochrysis_carterae.AAC.1
MGTRRGHWRAPEVVQPHTFIPEWRVDVRIVRDGQVVVIQPAAVERVEVCGGGNSGDQEA